MPSLLGRPSEPCLLRQSGYSTVSHYALVAMMPMTRNLLPQAISSSSAMGCLCHQEPSKMRTCFPASSGEGDKSSQTTSEPDGCTSTYPCSGAKEMDPQTTQPGSQWSGSCCNRECPMWPLTARPSHKSISSPGWFGSYSQSQDKEFNTVVPNFQVVPFGGVKVTTNIESDFQHLNSELFLELYWFK